MLIILQKPAYKQTKTVHVYRQTCAVKPRFFLSEGEIFVRHPDVGLSSAIDATGAYPLKPPAPSWSGLGRTVTAQQADCWSHKLELTTSPEKNSSAVSTWSKRLR